MTLEMFGHLSAALTPIPKSGDGGDDQLVLTEMANQLYGAED
jgi:hypothetical protein